MIVRLGRKYRFFAAHRLHTPKLTDEENAKLFGKCNHPGGHGHTYDVDVIVSGKPDLATNMIMDLADLDRLSQQVIDELAYKQIEKDVSAFSDTVSTTENVVAFIYDNLEPKLADFNAQLQRVEVAETRNNRFEAVNSLAVKERDPAL